MSRIQTIKYLFNHKRHPVHKTLTFFANPFYLVRFRLPRAPQGAPPVVVIPARITAPPKKRNRHKKSHHKVASFAGQE